MRQMQIETATEISTLTILDKKHILVNIKIW